MRTALLGLALLFNSVAHAGSYPIPAPGTSGNVMTSNGSKWTSAVSAASPGAGLYTRNVGIDTSVSGNALTIKLVQSDGSSNCSGSAICYIPFRSATAATGSVTWVEVSAALSTVVSSGSTLGCISAVECIIHIYALNNAGAVELAYSQYPYPPGELMTTTAEGGAGAANSALGLYSTSARSSVAFYYIGRIKVTEATAGTWATAPSEERILAYSDAIAGIRPYYRATAANDCVWTTTSATFVEPAENGGGCTYTEDKEHLMSVAQKASSALGVTITPPRAGLVYHIIIQVTYSHGTTANALELRLSCGSEVLETKIFSNGTSGSVLLQHLEGTYQDTTGSAFSCFVEGIAGGGVGTLTLGFSSSGRTNFHVEQLSL